MEIVRQNINVAVDKSIFMASDFCFCSPGHTAPRSYKWIACYFIPGLGQLLMGDFWRGFQFTFLSYSANFLFIYGSLTFFWKSFSEPT